uniref:Cytochrome c oxidase subunit 2 n=1 Tax=Amblyseiulella paraheveae TaxID=3049516 RepID=A0AAU6PBN5_9ACAR
MPFWLEIYFMDSSSPCMEQMILFYDYSMMIITTISIFLIMMMTLIMNNKIMNLVLIEEQLIELIWSILPIYLLIFLAVPSLRLLYLMEEAFKPDMSVKIMGHQWYWSYEYSELDMEFDSFMENLTMAEKSLINLDMFRLLEVDNYLAIPMNTFTRMLVSSVDVIHSWTVQSLGIKTDAIPGRLNQINMFSFRPGLFYGQCSEICGSNHSFMPISLKIMPMEEFIDQVDN